MNNGHMGTCGRDLLFYLVAEENKNVPGALMVKDVDMKGWEDQELSQLPHQLHSTEFIQGDLLVKAWRGWGVAASSTEVGSLGMWAQRPT